MRPVGDHSSPPLPHSQLYCVVASPRSAGKGGRGWGGGDGGGDEGGGREGGGGDAAGGGGDANTLGGGGEARRVGGGGETRTAGGGGGAGDGISGGEAGGGDGIGGGKAGGGDLNGGGTAGGGDSAARGGGAFAVGGLPALGMQGPLTQKAGRQKAGLVLQTPCRPRWVGGEEHYTECSTERVCAARRR